ncbi:hypothetical protein VTN96DRAFT_5053 [Rasamsonia emersonii]
MYATNKHEWLEAVFGFGVRTGRDDGPVTQEIGSVSCLEGRLLTFPNILQHRVSPFALADRTKPDHRNRSLPRRPAHTHHFVCKRAPAKGGLVGGKGKVFKERGVELPPHRAAEHGHREPRWVPDHDGRSEAVQAGADGGEKRGFSGALMLVRLTQ